MVVLSFEITKIQPGQYRVHVTSGGVAVTEPSVYSSIEVAIQQESSSGPEGFARIGQVTYGGVSSGTMAITQIAVNAPQIAAQLVT